MGTNNNKDPLEVLTEIEARIAEMKANAQKAKEAKTRSGFFTANPEEIKKGEVNLALISEIHERVVQVKNRALNVTPPTKPEEPQQGKGFGSSG